MSQGLPVISSDAQGHTQRKQQNRLAHWRAWGTWQYPRRKNTSWRKEGALRLLLVWEGVWQPRAPWASHEHVWGSLLSRRHNFPINEETKSHWNNQFNLTNILIKKMTHNCEFSAGIALFFLGKQYTLTSYIIKRKLLTGIFLCLENTAVWQDCREDGRKWVLKILTTSVSYFDHQSSTAYTTVSRWKMGNKMRKEERKNKTKLWCKNTESVTCNFLCILNKMYASLQGRALFNNARSCSFYRVLEQTHKKECREHSEGSNRLDN